ncbi:inorganic phosphate transporter [Permianibacter aggregans]|uniref:Phosphate transporter n=1 Tax=Permianibacter aggregans TaxID=1510150 RepID=A0A4V3D8B9_9GAMM|nr:inorganic phosphate transporter [Permianibacter aggregans]QGX41388.1 inorganic phosphate transporter [Permianibacter aggregans]TDQ51177.1 PiT family inorganic phosphate transporter [Permianibacter aggregans]
MNVIIENYGSILLILACVVGFFMAWGIGANDVSNAMGTSVGSKAITIKQAILIAAVFEFAGAFLAGGEVTSTIRSGIVDPTVFNDKPDLLVFGMIASLLAAGTWLAIATFYGWPVSTTHSIVGAIAGFAAVGVGMDAVQWSKFGTIVISWITSPLLSAFIAFWIFRSVQYLILDKEGPFGLAKKYVPYYMLAVGFIMAFVTLTKGLKHLGLPLTTMQSFWYSLGVGVVVMSIGMVLLRRIKLDPAADREFHFTNVERVFAILMVFSACAMAFAHGSNDVANAIGPLAAIHSVLSSGGLVASKAALPTWILLLGGVGIVIGLATYGYRVIETIGHQITHLTPTRGFSAEFATASAVVVASGIGMPISTTHTLVGAVVGVGLARGIGALNLGVVRTIFTSWIITVPAGAALSILFFFILKYLFV